MTRNDGSAISYTYDGLGRLTWYGGSDVARAFGYDWCGNGLGRLCNADHGGGTRHYGYTQDGRISVTRDWTPSSDDWTSYVYDSVGRLTGLSYPSGVAVGYGFNLGELVLTQATIGGTTHNVVTGMQRNPYGALSRLVYGNGVIKDRVYDLDGRLTVIHDYGWLGHTQTYDANNNIVSIDNWSRSNDQQYAYDVMGRISSASAPAGSQSLAYDANGNRTTYDWYPGAPEHYQIDPVWCHPGSRPPLGSRDTV